LRKLKREAEHNVNSGLGEGGLWRK